MNDDIDFIKNRFFIITNENCAAIENKFYGFVNDGCKFLLGDRQGEKLLNNTDYGAYINIVSNGNDLVIQQDYYGLYSLYIYEKDGNFAVSNSFLYLLSYLHSRVHLSYNYKFAHTLIWTGMSLCFRKSIINEIYPLPHFYMLHIDKKKKQLSKIRIKQQRDIINLDTKAGISLLDDWHRKWNGFARSIAKSSGQLQVNISGGKDSRAALSAVFDPLPEQEISKICFYSSPLPHAAKDLAIATEIAEKLRIPLHQEYAQVKKSKLTTFMCLAGSFLSKLAFHNEFHTLNDYYESPFYVWGGRGGEGLRGYWDEEPEEFLSWFIPPMAERYRQTIIDSLVNSMDNICAEYHSPHGLSRGIYECCFAQNHFGKYTFEDTMFNFIPVMPLLDPALDRLNMNVNSNRDRTLLFAVIYDRYLPQIEDLPFDKGSKFNPETRQLARDINQRFPFALAETGIPDFKIDYLASPIKPGISDSSPEPAKALQELAFSAPFNAIITKMFDADTYNYALTQYKGLYSNKSEQLTALISCYLAFMAISPRLLKENTCEWINELVNIYDLCNGRENDN